MDKKIQLGISANTTEAVAGIEKVTKAQAGLVTGAERATQALKAAKSAAGQVRQFETLTASLKATQEQKLHNAAALAKLKGKQTQFVKLTDAETVALKTNQNTVAALNAKKQQGVSLSTAEQNQLMRAEAAVSKLTLKQQTRYELTQKEQKEAKRLAQSLDNLTIKERNQTRQLDELNRKLHQAGIGTHDLAKARDVANRRAEKSALLLERENRLMARANQLTERKREVMASLPSAEHVALGITAAGALAGRESMHNEAAFVDVAKTLDFGDQGFRSQEAQAMRRELNKLAVEMAGANDSDVMKIAAGGANGGIAKEDLVAYTRDTIMTATAWDMSADDAAQKGMALRNSLGYEQGAAGQAQFLHMSNMINDVANQNGGVSGRDLLGVMSRTGALMTNSGFSESQALALAGSLLSKGASEEEAATASKNISSALTAGFSATGSQKEIFAMLGTDAQTVALDMQADAMGTLQEVLQGIKTLNKEDQSAAIKALFGDEANPHIQKLLKDTERLSKIQQEAANASASSVKDEYAAIASTNLSGAERAMDAFGNLATVVGDKLMPAFNAVLDPVVDLTVATTDWIADAGVASDVVLGLGAAMVAGVAAYKVYQGVKFATNVASIAKETLALNRQQSATDRATASLDRHSRAMERQSRAAKATDMGEPRRQRSTRRKGRRRRKGVAGMFGTALDFASGALPRGMVPSKGMALKTGAGLLTAGVALPTFAADGLNEAAAITGTVGDTLDGLHVDKFAKLAGVLRPLTVGLDAVSVVTNLVNGDTDAAVESGGGLLGGLGGAAAGAAIGTAILPGIGTAIGAGLGGILGDSAGETIASTVMGWFRDDKDATALASSKDTARPVPDSQSWVSPVKLPDQTEAVKTAQITKVTQTPPPPIVFSPTIEVTGAIQPQETAALTSERIKQLFEEMLVAHGLSGAALTQDIEHSLVT